MTSTVKDLVIGAGIDFGEAGVHELKGVPGSWPLFEVRGMDASDTLVPAAMSSDHIGRFDRAAMRIAKRAPATSRFFARMAGAPK